MKKRFQWLPVLLTAIFLSTFSVSAEAASITDGLPLTALPMDGRESAYRILTSFSKEETIVAFDASEEMGIVLVTSFDSSEKHVRYMDPDGSVIACYAVEGTGEIGVAWDGSEICLFFTRGHVIEIIDGSGCLKGRFSLERINYETDKAWEALAHREKKETAAFIINRIRIRVRSP